MEKKFLSKKEFAAATSLSLPTVNRRLKDKTIKAVRLSGRVLIPVSELDRLAQGAAV
ncbi:MAG: helix-turn-helix domain-containing protein [Spirochaetales bacterium]|nr:helix-turn-helix domain-containing protein [Spirochaetales bacterium]